ncbi:hypothetical protein ACQEV2_00015 [Streptomyces sp. CA-251387]|uniref:hypothetical protein n=1 Tax=Streptomyces sp. CA-251387 TaxID=3240064 RepID=UPI003D903B57
MPEQLYDRTSRACAIGDLDPRLRTMLLAAAETELLSDVEATAVGCVETRSVPRRRPGVFARLLGGGALRETLTAAVLLPRHLLVAVTDMRAGTTTAHAGRLADMTVTEVDQRLAVDSGVSVFTRWSNRAEAESMHIALGDDPAGVSFKDMLRQAVRAAKSS